MTTSAAGGGAPMTLCLDIGGTGLKAAVVDSTGIMVGERQRIDTTYPLPPDLLVEKLVGLTRPLTSYDRISVGFPGVVRSGRVLTAPHFVTRSGPGSRIEPKLVSAWSGFPLAETLSSRLGRPARLGNDADVQGSAAVSGEGLELVLTLGTGLGSALFTQGRLAAHLELAHHPFRKGETYDEQVGERARRRIGTKRWRRRVARAIVVLDALVVPDRIWIGGGNAARLGDGFSADVRGSAGPKIGLVDNADGLLGGVRLWDDATRPLWEDAAAAVPAPAARSRAARAARTARTAPTGAPASPPRSQSRARSRQT